MNFELTPEQKQLADSVSKYLINEYSFEKRKAIISSESGVSAAAWQTFADMGLTAMTLTEADNGFGGGAMDLMAVMEAMGEALVVEPFLDNVGLAGRLVSRMGSDAQRAALLPGLIDGSERLAFAYLEQGHRYQLAPQLTVAKSSAGAWVLNGRKCLVTGAASARHLLVSALTPQGASLFIVDTQAAGVELNPSRTVDGFRVADVAFSNVSLHADALLGDDGADGLGIICVRHRRAVRIGRKMVLRNLAFDARYEVGGENELPAHRSSIHPQPVLSAEPNWRSTSIMVAWASPAPTLTILWGKSPRKRKVSPTFTRRVSSPVVTSSSPARM
mgnify:CR=1 FL=1